MEEVKKMSANSKLEGGMTKKKKAYPTGDKEKILSSKSEEQNGKKSMGEIGGYLGGGERGADRQAENIFGESQNLCWTENAYVFMRFSEHL